MHAYDQQAPKLQQQYDANMTEEAKEEQKQLKQQEQKRRAEFVFKVPELIHLNFAIKCLQMPVHSKKLLGGTLLIQKVTSVTPKAGDVKSWRPSVKWLNSETLLSWLIEQQIFSIFFGASLNAEVIKKSYYLLDFLYKNDQIQEKELNKMWMVATKKHEAFKASIFSALQFIVMRGMKPKELNFLYEKLKSMPLREHDKFSLNLLKTIAKGLAPPVTQRKQKQDYSKVNLPLISSLKRRGSAD